MDQLPLVPQSSIVLFGIVGFGTYVDWEVQRSKKDSERWQNKGQSERKVAHPVLLAVFLSPPHQKQSQNFIPAMLHRRT